MIRRARSSGRATRTLTACVALGLLGTLTATLAQGERTQHGSLIVSLDGGLAPLTLPRQHPAPVAVRLGGGLSTEGGGALPRVTKIELGLPGQGVISTRGLPRCPLRQLRNATPSKALENCRAALVGNGHIEADVVVPHQPPFRIHSSVLVFNGRVHGRRAVFVHAFAASPPSVAVLPFVIKRRAGRFGTALVAELPPSLGPWPHFAHFEMTLSRRFTYRGHTSSFISATCPIPPRFTAGFFSFAKATYTLVGGRRVSTGIARSCRAR